MFLVTSWPPSFWTVAFFVTVAALSSSPLWRICWTNDDGQLKAPWATTPHWFLSRLYGGQPGRARKAWKHSFLACQSWKRARQRTSLTDCDFNSQFVRLLLRFVRETDSFKLEHRQELQGMINLKDKPHSCLPFRLRSSSYARQVGKAWGLQIECDGCGHLA